MNIKNEKDFTFSVVEKLIKTVLSKGYSTGVLKDRTNTIDQKRIMFRHDVDAREENSLQMAIIQKNNQIWGTYYFREFKYIKDLTIITQIADLGHEIGYHYEDLVRNKGNYAKAIEDFKYNLDRLRKYYPVRTICADGNPWSKWGNLWLWNKYDYKSFGIECEVYLDIDYNEIAYYTDTGRCWDGHHFNVWDKVKTEKNWPLYHSTFDIISAIEEGKFPQKAVLNFHPQRWSDKSFPWLREIVLQNTKNVVKSMIVKNHKILQPF